MSAKTRIQQLEKVYPPASADGKQNAFHKPMSPEDTVAMLEVAMELGMLSELPVFNALPADIQAEVLEHESRFQRSPEDVEDDTADICTAAH